MNKIEQVRLSIETAMARIGCPPGDNADADIYRDLQRSLAILKDMDGQEPVADEEQELADHYLYMGWLGARPDRPWTDEDAREAFLHALEYARTHPSPSAPVDIAEIIAAGDAMSRALMLNERYNVDGGLDEGMNRIDIECSNAWTTATAKHRTA